MAAKRDRPYGQFNFLVDLGGGGGTTGADAGFQECSNVGMEVTVAEYRNGNSLENHVIKITGLNKATDVTLKRGIIGSATLYNWLDSVRLGDETHLRTVRIQLMSEDHNTTVATWVLDKARIIKYVSGPFNAKGGDIAMEELTIAYEMMTLEDAS
jgi:phage tail-like protein